MKRLAPPLAALVLATTAIVAPARAQQVADSTFHPVVARPAFVTRHPRVVLDQAHHNFHTLEGRYRAFGELLTRDGCTVSAGQKPFSKQSLSGTDVLVIANAAGDDLESGTDSSVALPAFTAAEIATVREWVHAGGALLLIADHLPFGEAAQALGARFGVDMSRGMTIDTTESLPGQGNPGIIEFTRERGRLGDHVILAGRDSAERINRVVAFTGQSLRGPDGSAALLRLSDRALDIPPGVLRLNLRDPRVMMRGAHLAAGRAVGVALETGRGRVVVLGEAAMLSAQLILRPDGEALKMGMNREGLDNQQFALNVVRWLARGLN